MSRDTAIASQLVIVLSLATVISLWGRIMDDIVLGVLVLLLMFGGAILFSTMAFYGTQEHKEDKVEDVPTPSDSLYRLHVAVEDHVKVMGVWAVAMRKEYDRLLKEGKITKTMDGIIKECEDAARVRWRS